MIIAGSALRIVALRVRVAAGTTRGVVRTASVVAAPKQAVAPPVQADRPALHVGVLIRPVAALTPCSGAPMLHVCAPALHAAAPKPRVCTVMIVCHALRRRFPYWITVVPGCPLLQEYAFAHQVAWSPRFLTECGCTR